MHIKHISAMIDVGYVSVCARFVTHF